MTEIVGLRHAIDRASLNDYEARVRFETRVRVRIRV